MASKRLLLQPVVSAARVSQPRSLWGTTRMASSSRPAAWRAMSSNLSLPYPHGRPLLQEKHKSPQQLQQQQQLRWRHAGKIGHMKETLEELAHQPERDAAQEKRKQKKEKAAAKRTKKKKGSSGSSSSNDDASATTTTAPVVGNDLVLDADYEDDDLDLEIDFDDDEEDANDGENVEPTLPDTDQVQSKMMAYVDRFQESLKSIRGVEPNPEMFDDIQVSAYGSQTPLKAVGQVVIVSPTLAQITCFDPSVAKDVLKAIQLALELNPQAEEGGTIKVPLPRVSMEVREQTAKQFKKKAESTKQRIRQVRRKAMDVIKKGKDGKLTGISKDDAFASGKEIDGVTESAMGQLQGMVDEKMDSIMAV